MPEVSAGIVVTGLLIGLSYGVLAAGLVLVFRASGVLNLAHAQVGAFGAALLARMVLDGGVPWAVALPLVLVVGAGLSALVELVVVRRLRASPRVVVLVATLGVSQLLLVAEIALPDVGVPGTPYPVAFDRVVRFGSVDLDGAGFLTLGLVPAAVVLLAVFLERTPTGLAVRAAADNRDAAVLSGISTGRVATLVWALAGALAVLTVVLGNGLLRTRVGAVDTGLGPGLLLRALTAALVGRLLSLPLALVGGALIGVLDALLLVNVPTQPGLTDLVLFGIVLLLVLSQVRGSASAGGDTASLGLPADRPVPPALAGTWWAPRLGLLGAGAALLAALTVPALGLSAGALAEASRVPLFAIVGLSLVVLTGWSGQLSLGQVALYGTGAFGAAALVARGVPFWAAVLEATVLGVLVALVIGVPALVVRGLYLAVTTLAFAVAASSAVFQSDLLVGGSGVATLEPGTLLGLDLRDGTTYYYVCLGALVLCCALVSALRRSGIGRGIVAVRGNSDRAASFTVSPAVARLTAFAVSGGLAAFAGALLAGLQRTVSYTQFTVYDSLTAVTVVLIGGVGSVAGAVLGTAYVFGVPALFGDGDVARLLTSSLGLLVLLLYLPGGLRSLLLLGRDAVLAAVAARRPLPDDDDVAAARPPAVVLDRGRPDDGPPALAATGITVRFGGRTALDGVDLVARRGEVLGLIGANGAGKSTLLGVCSGFVRPASGTLELFGQDVTRLSPHERARLGVGRVFQDARLFDDLTVRECVLVALEARERAELVPSLLALPPARKGERRKQALATDALGRLGLSRYADSQVRTLSTGTRRVVELACLLASEAELLLLDEPTAGLAQRETEAFGPLLLQVRAELDATLVVVEHDIPLVMGISDRVQCLSAGRTLLVGTPEEVRNDPAVIASYLGTDERAIVRSGALSGAGVSGAGATRSGPRAGRPSPRTPARTPRRRTP